MTPITNFGKELRKLRLDLGITLFQMAKDIGVSSSMLSSVETGRKAVPDSLIEVLAGTYPQIRNNLSLYKNLADATKSEVRLQLNNRPAANELAVAFARNFETLTDKEIREMMALFKSKSREKQGG